MRFPGATQVFLGGSRDSSGAKDFYCQGVAGYNIIVFVVMEIMSAPRLTRINVLLGCLLLAASPGLFAGEIVLQKVPPLTVEQSPAYPQNLARYYVGAQVEAIPQSNPIASLQLSSKSEDHNVAEAALLCNDPTVGYAISNGSTTLVISLSRIENIDSISFLNNGVKGNLVIATADTKLSAESMQWQKIAQQDLTSNIVKVKIGPSDAKYVKLTFNVNTPGRIAELGVYSTPAVADFTMPRSRKVMSNSSDNFSLISYNFTDVHSRARALYVSSGGDLTAANNMIDDQPATSFSFSGNDTAPTAIIDLGKTTNLRRLSAIYTARSGSVDFYVLQSLPGTASDGTLRINDIALDDLKPVGSAVIDAKGRVAVDFPSTSGRYVMVKWNLSSGRDKPFSVSEIAAFGNGASEPANLIVANTSLAGLSDSSAIDSKDGKDLGEGKEAKEVAEGPAEGPPPTLPDPPPFVFVPEIVPTSP